MEAPRTRVVLTNVRKVYEDRGIAGVWRVGIRKMLRLPPLRYQSPVLPCLHEILQNDEVAIVQIGAHVGDTSNDPFFKILAEQKNQPGTSNRRKIILVEPVKDHFDRLTANYAGMPGVYFENVAIAAQSGSADFFRLAVDPVAHGFPDWLSQLGSLKKDRMEGLWENYEANPDYQEFYLKHRVVEKVACLSFHDLMKKHGLQRVDLLQMDIEGFEAEVLQSIDFQDCPIRFINYERVLLFQQKGPCERRLKQQGYHLLNHGQDTFACRTPDTAKAEIWQFAN